MIVDNDVIHDARVRKEAASLAAHGWRVVLVGISRSGPVPPASEVRDGYTIERVNARLLRHQLTNKIGWILRTLETYLRAAWRLRQINARMYHAHDFTGLIICGMAGVRPVIYDSHEIYFERPMQPLTRMLSAPLRRIEKVLAQKAVRMIATGDGHAEVFKNTLGIRQAPVIVRNAIDLNQTGTALELPQHYRVLVAHSGWLIGGRHLSELIEAMTHLPDDVGLALVGGGSRRESLLHQAAQLGIEQRVHNIARIVPEEIVPTLAQATVAAVLVQADPSQGLSHHLSLPNKVFEAIAAGLPIITGPSPSVVSLVEQYDIGVICDPQNPQSIADAIQRITQPENLQRYQENVQRARHELTWEAEARKLIALYEEAFAQARS